MDRGLIEQAVVGDFPGMFKENAPEELKDAASQLMRLQHEGSEVHTAYAAKWTANTYFLRGLQHLSWNPNTGFSTLSQWLAATDKKVDQSIQDYSMNIYRMYYRPIYTVLANSSYNVKMSPARSDEECVEAADRADGNVEWLERENDRTAVIGAIAHNLIVYGNTGAYWSPARHAWLTTDEPEYESQEREIAPGFAACPRCAQVVSPAQAPGRCPQCGAPQTYTPPYRTTVEVETARHRKPLVYPKVTIVPPIQLYPPYYEPDSQKWQYLIRERDVPIYHLRALGYESAGKDASDGGGYGAGYGGDTSTDRRLEHSMKTIAGGTDLTAYAQYRVGRARVDTLREGWFLPESYYAISRDNAHREMMEDLYPNGCKIIYVGNKFVSIQEENMRQRWTFARALPTESAFGDGLLDDVVQPNKIINDSINLIEDYVQRASNGFGAYDAGALPPGATMQDIRNEAGIYIPMRPKFEKSVAQLFYESHPQQLAGAAFQLPNMMTELSKNFAQVNDALVGNTAQANATASGMRMQLSRAIGNFQIAVSSIRSMIAQMYQQGLRMMEDLLPQNLEVPTQDETGRWIGLKLNAQGMSSVVVNAEVDDNAPIFQQDKLNAFLDFMNTGLITPQDVRGDSTAQARIESLTGMRDIMPFPGQAQRHKSLRRIALLRGQKPTEHMQQDPQTEQPVPVRMPSIVPEEGLDEPAYQIPEFTNWLNSQTAELERLNNPDGYENVKLYWTLLRQMASQQQDQQQQPKPAPKIAINYRDLTPSGQTQAAAEAGIQISPEEVSQDKQEQASMETQRVAAQAQINRAVTQGEGQ